MEKEMVALCREINKDTGEIATYALDMKVDARSLFCLQIRQRFNPELRYYITWRTNYEENGPEILAMLKRKKVTDVLLFAWNVVGV